MGKIIRTSILIGLAIILLLAAVIFIRFPFSSQGQTETSDTLMNYFIQLRDSNRLAYIGLIAPIDGNPGWAVPEDFTNDAGEIVARRIIGDVGADFVCIDSLGQGLTVTLCIPFSNIAFVRQPAP